MLTIRLSKADWAKAWRAMIEVAPVRLVADDPVYEVVPSRPVPRPPSPGARSSHRPAGGR